ncbi:MAG TPA: tetratricopeptide repeat protein [Ktedonobacteraceae bacterium]|nr:tetratricopeptide repeat protein [Ktedonobacteraceae bacterium]
MDAQQQGQQPEKRHKGLYWKSARRIIYILIAISLIFFILGAIIWILTELGFIHGDWADKLFTILTGLGAGATAFLALFGIFQFILSLIPDESKAATAPTNQSPPTSIQTPSSPPASPPTQEPLYISAIVHPPVSRGIAGFPPPTNASAILQREQTVQDIYNKLTQSGVSAVVLTGIGGQGKSTLAALVYRHAETQQRAGRGYFTAAPLWLRVDPAVTLADILANVCDALGVRAPDLAALSPQNQAYALFNILNSVDQPRLLVLDQFENLLDDEGRARDDRPGVGEWLDALNSDPCACRVLLTSRPDPQGTRDYPSACLLIHPLEGLSEAEGTELLRKWNVNATEAEMRAAVRRCNGHALSLTLLASLLQKRRLSLAALLNDPQLWKGNLAKKLLDDIYQELSDPQRKLLAAFSIYREPVPIEAAQAIASDAALARTQSESALDVLLGQHLLDAKGEGRYQPHAIVAEYARDHLVMEDQQANHQTLLAAHARAARYYQERAKTTCPPRKERRKIEDVQDLIEAVWHYCQAEQWRDAYELMEAEYIFEDVNRWGGNIILLELYQLMPLNKSLLNRSQEANIYNNMGEAYYALSNYREAFSYYEQALRAYKEARDSKGEGVALINIGVIYDELGQKQEALDYYERGLAISREVGNRDGEGTILNNLGRVYTALGQKQEALDYYEQALAIGREVGDRGVEGYTLWNLGVLFYYTNVNAHCDVALACFLLARSIFEEVQSPNRDEVQEWIDKLLSKVGDEQYNALLARVEPRAGEIVEQALREGGML